MFENYWKRQQEQKKEVLSRGTKQISFHIVSDYPCLLICLAADELESILLLLLHSAKKRSSQTSIQWVLVKFLV